MGPMEHIHREKYLLHKQIKQVMLWSRRANGDTTPTAIAKEGQAAGERHQAQTTTLDG